MTMQKSLLPGFQSMYLNGIGIRLLYKADDVHFLIENRLKPIETSNVRDATERRMYTSNCKQE